MNKTCAKCSRAVYPVEELKCLDKIWHKTCFKCYECGMTLNMKTYKGFNKLPYCNAHTPVARATTVADTPENRRLAENTKIQSQVKYHADFEQQKGKLTQVADDPETLRIRNASKIISNVTYHGEYEKKKQMEERRNMLESDNNNLGPYMAVEKVTHVTPASKNVPYDHYSNTNNNIVPQQQVVNTATPTTIDYHQRNAYAPYGNNGNPMVMEQNRPTDYYKANNAQSGQKVVMPGAPNANANYITDPRYVSSQIPPQMAAQHYQQQQQQLHHQQMQQHMQAQPQYHHQQHPPQQLPPQLGHDNRYNSGAMPAMQQQNMKPYGATNLGRCFRAIYDYTAQDVDEVGFLDGDLIINCQPIDDGWMTGTVQRTGKTGMLPSNYVETA